jgi:hypothetical protein
VSVIAADPGATRAAARWCDRIVTADVEQADLREVFPEAPFDAIVALNVLEELREPGTTVSRLVELLAPGGRFIASIANVAHAAVRFQLLRGRFAGAEPGLLDPSRLHHFDRPAAEALLVDAGLDIVERLRVRRGRSDAELGIDIGEFPPAVVDAVLSGPDAETHHFVLVGTPHAAYPAATMRSIGAGKEARQLAKERDALALALEAADRRGAEMSARIEELSALEDQLRHLRSDLEIKDAYCLELHSELSRANAQCRTEAEQRGELEAELAAVTARASYRIIQRVERSFADHPVVRRALVALARRVAP